MRLGSLTWPPTHRAMPQERNDSVSLRSKTCTVQSGCAVRMACAAKVPACVQPTIATVLERAVVRATPKKVKRLSNRNDIKKKTYNKG